MVTSTITYTRDWGDEGRESWTAAGQVVVMPGGVTAYEVVLASTLEMARAVIGWAGPYQQHFRAVSSYDGCSCEWELKLTDLVGAYPAEDIRDGEREITSTRDEQHGITTLDRGTYVGGDALGYVLNLIASKPHARRTEYSYTFHKVHQVSWSIESIAAAPGEASSCVAFRERISQERDYGRVSVKAYASSDPILVSESAATVLRFVQEGQAVSDDPDVFIREPERVIPGEDVAPRQLSFERLNRRQNITTWRYESVAVGDRQLRRPHKRDEASGAYQAGSGPGLG